jgi:YVTN family beta-propeller protein
MRKKKLFGLTLGIAAFLAGCADLTFFIMTRGCPESPAACPSSFESADGGQCTFTYYTLNDDGKTCTGHITEVPFRCASDTSTPSEAPSTKSKEGLLAAATAGIPFPANQMAVFRSESSSTAPFDFKEPVRSLPFRPVLGGRTVANGTGSTCDPAVVVLSAGYRRGTVLPMNPCKFTMGAEIATGAGSLEIVITPDGKQAWVTNYNGSVVVIDTAALSVSTTIQVPGTHPFGIAMSPDGATAYVASYDAVSPALVLIDVPGRKVRSTTAVAVPPQNLFVSPDGLLLWVTSQLANNVAVYDTLTLTRVAAITSIPLPTGVAFNPTGTVAYIASATAPGTVQAVNTTDYSVTKSYTVGNEPADLRMAGSKYVTVMNRTSDFVSQIDVDTGNVISSPADNVKNVSHTGLAIIQ